MRLGAIGDRLLRKKSLHETPPAATYHAPALDRVLAPEYVEAPPLGDLDARDRVLGFYNPGIREVPR
jgi:hypothetical protein